MKTGCGKRGREMMKRDICINTLIARLFPVYESRLHQGRNLSRSRSQYFASGHACRCESLEIAIRYKALHIVTENILIFQQQ